MNTPLRWVALACLAVPTTVLANGDGLTPKSRPERLELAVRYDFFLTEGSRVNDASGKRNHGTLSGGKIIEGRRKNAVRFDGAGAIVVEPGTTIDPTARSFTLGAVCKPSTRDGVIASMGDANDGFSLYVKQGIAHFAVRTRGKLTEVADSESLPLDQWSHVIGGIDEAGEVWLVVNGYLTAHAHGTRLLSRPAESLAIGDDPGATVVDYRGPSHWNGLLQDVRLYWGFIDLKADREDMKDWADLSGCGCK